MALIGSKSKGLRGAFFVSTAITTIAPYGGWYGLCAWYIYDSFAVPYDETGGSYKDTLSYIDWYIYVKMFLAVALTCINTFITSEMVKPIYEWWQVLAVLEDTVPYDRPTAEDVESGDTADSGEGEDDASSASGDAEEAQPEGLVPS